MPNDLPDFKYSSLDESAKASSMAAIRDQAREVIQFFQTTQERVLNQIFLVNSGGTAALLTYLATKDDHSWRVRVAGIFFLVGLICNLLHGARAYYFTQANVKSFRGQAAMFLQDEISHGELWGGEGKRGEGLAVLARLSWAAGLAAVLGCSFTIWRLLY